ncbi:MAG: NADPH-dependent F420 reductase [Acidobacteria bacterium]|nr:MAG: NADPH-dependent F420 reductase [Acidobacteriota bacterium]
MQQVVAVVGGTGAEGSGLAVRFAKAGLRVLIGSRNLDRAQAVASEIAAQAGAGEVIGHTNPDAVSKAAIVILTVPLSAQVDILKSIRTSFLSGAILVDATVPLEIAVGGRLSRTVSLWDGSAAQQAARLAPAGVPVVATFHALSAEALKRIDQLVDCDALICGDNPEAKATVSEIAETIPGVRAIDAGPLDSARFLESSAALLIALNLRHKVKHCGLRITGLGPGEVYP